MTRVPDGYTLEEYVLADLQRDDQAAVRDLFNRLTAERDPRHSDWSLDEILTVFGSPGEIRKRFLVRDRAGTPIAHASASYADDGSNPDWLRVGLFVDAGHRRQGIGSALLTAAAEVASTLGRSSLSGFVVDTVPAASEFVKAVGGVRSVEHQTNVLPLTELDKAMMEQWSTDGPSRAKGYSVEIIDGAYPEEILDRMAHLYVVLERDMPTPEGQDPRNWDAEQVVQFVDTFLEFGDMLTAVVFLDATGEAAGMSQLLRRHGDHKTWIVTTTMVDPEHRGHALGKWLKSAVSLEALRVWPGGEYQETGNAETNEAMLSINRAMGFRTESTLAEVEADVSAVVQHLSTRTD